MWTYIPRAASTPLSSLVVFDGRVYKDLLHLPQILDYLIEHSRIRPVAALMIESPDRSELQCDPSFSRHVANEIVPRFRSDYDVSDRVQDCVVAGSSYGGLAAAFTVLSHPDVFGAALCQGGWFRWHPSADREHHWLARQIPRLTDSSLRFWLQVGNLETAEMLDGGPSQLAANRHFRDALQAHGFGVSYEEYTGGHDTSSLEAPLARAMTEIFGTSTDA